MQLLAFRVAEETYALHLESVERVVRAVEVTPVPGAPAGILGVIIALGRLIPVLNLRQRIGLQEREVDISDFFIIVNLPSRTLALWVDEVIGVMELPEKSVIRAADLLPGATEVEGMVKTAQGIAFIQDPEALYAPLASWLKHD